MMSMAEPAFPPIEDYVPHRGGMLLLDAVVAATETDIETELHVSADAWYCRNADGMPAWFGIELMAQSVAAHVTHLARARGQPPKQGVLLGTNAYRSAVPAFACGAILRVRAREAYRDAAGFAAYDCEIAQGTQVLASANIKAFQPDDFREFLSQAAA